MHNVFRRLAACLHLVTVAARYLSAHLLSILKHEKYHRGLWKVQRMQVRPAELERKPKKRRTCSQSTLKMRMRNPLITFRAKECGCNRIVQLCKEALMNIISIAPCESYDPSNQITLTKSSRNFLCCAYR